MTSDGQGQAALATLSVLVYSVQYVLYVCMHAITGNTHRQNGMGMPCESKIAKGQSHGIGSTDVTEQILNRVGCSITLTHVHYSTLRETWLLM